MKRIIKITSLLIFLHFQSFAYNLTPIVENSNLSNSSVTDFCQDEKGYMLIGTCDGLNFYNGRDVVAYQPKNENNFLSGNVIDKIIYTGEDIFWIQTYYGLNKYDARTNSVTHYNEFQKLFFIDKDQSGNIFIIHESNCIYYYHKSSASFKKILISGIVFSDIINIAIDNNNILWIITNKGYHLSYKIIENASKDEISLTSTKNNMHFQDILLQCFHDDGLLHVIDKEYNLFTYNLQTNKKSFVYNLKDKIQSRGKVSAIVRHQDDYFIGFHTNGLLLLEKENGNNAYQKKEFEINCGIFCLKKDGLQDIVWIGTDGKGAYTYSKTAYSIRSNLLSNLKYKIERPVRALFLDNDNTLWIGSKGDGILKIYDYDINRSIYDSRIESFNTSNSNLSDNIVYAFGKSNRNILWIGSEEGLSYYSYRTKKVEKIALKIDGQKSRYLHTYEGYSYMVEPDINTPKFRYIHDIYETSDSKLWIASVGLGIICADIEGTDDNPHLTNIRHYSINNGDFESNYFFSIYAENDSSLWFANRGYGTFHFNPQTENLDPINHFNKYTNQTINDVFAIRKDASGNLLIGTGYGLIKYTSPENYKIFNSHNGFQNNSIHAIQNEDDNTFWLSTNEGIIRFNSKREVFRIFGKSDGLQITEFSDGASFKDDRNGTLLFGGINGFVAIQKDQGEEQEYMPNIFFNRLTIFGEYSNINENLVKHKNSDRLELKYKQNFFSVSFIAFDYIAGANYTYYYKIDELIDHWINNGQSNVASFSNLSPGNYTLMVKYYNRSTDKESDVYSLTIKIHPPWYQSTLAYIFYYLLLIIVIATGIRYLFLRQQRRKKAQLEELEKKHQKEVFESKLRFFTNIAHEFCTPLTLISGPCERILSRQGISKFVSNYVKMIQINAERLNSLIQELIEFRRIETGNRKLRIESVNVSTMIQDILAMFSDMKASKNISIDYDQNEIAIWNSDKGFLTTIISNLISNAFKHTPDEKKIKIELSLKETNLVLRVANEGKPIKEENFNRIFDRYSILDTFENQDYGQPFSRNGLGLAILDNMVSLLNGTINVSNTEDGFVLFSVELPTLELSPEETEIGANLSFYSPKIEQYKAIELPEYELDKSKATLLVIDDDIELLLLVSEIFSQEFNVKTTNTPEKIESILDEMLPDLIICDVMMPGLSGIELTKIIKSQDKTSHIPIMLVSGNHEIDQQIAAAEAGADIFINKPFDTKYLEISVRQIIKRNENLEDYYNSPISAYELAEGKLTHKEDKKFLKSVLLIIKENIANEDLSTQFIADKLGMGSRTLYRKMEEIGEKSLTDMIKDCKLQVAANLLMKSKLTIEEISYKSGFKNKVTFFKAFKTKYGCTPKNFRVKHENDIITN